MQTDPGIFIRQTGLADPAKLTMRISIIGAGSIGSWTSLALLKLGCSNVSVWDRDYVEKHNAGSQIYTSADSGKSKVDALRERLNELTDSTIETNFAMWDATNDLKDSGIIISAVDSMAVRAELFGRFRGEGRWFIDGRMAGNVIVIYAFSLLDTQACTEYGKTLFSDEEADPTPCSERSVVYNTLVCGGLIGAIVAGIANGRKPKFETEVDLFNLKMY